MQIASELLIRTGARTLHCTCLNICGVKSEMQKLSAHTVSLRSLSTHPHAQKEAQVPLLYR